MAVLTFNNKRLRFFDKDAINFIDAAGLDNDANINGEGNYTGKEARLYVDYMVKTLKACGAWDGIKAIHPFMGGTDITCMYNLKDPRDADDAFRIVWKGTMNFNSIGIQSDGTTGYGIIYYNPSIEDDDDSWLAVSTYSDDAPISGVTPIEIGTNDTGIIKAISTRINAGNYDGRCNTTAITSVGVPNGIGLHIQYSKSNGTQQFARKNGILLGSNTSTLSKPNNNFVICGRNDSPLASPPVAANITRRIINIAIIGSSALSDQQAIYLSHHIRAAQAILNRK
ncbi:hypothetical protein FW774_05845 [Pedobacter sp. BS3]|uniref:hypothetical protein n=1 Tax=Pedobacter sp. BS3 TaxID=2567937 RepID=UPI0011EEA529|nr:hypothetical protein [Pedobacter sp. BS3]TZF84509.1 hypothetical protein FW774_05845 [Pedobacter sp. BS3]